MIFRFTDWHIDFKNPILFDFDVIFFKNIFIFLKAAFVFRNYEKLRNVDVRTRVGDGQSDKHSIKQTHRQPDRHTDRQSHRRNETDNISDRHDNSQQSKDMQHNIQTHNNKDTDRQSDGKRHIDRLSANNRHTDRQNHQTDNFGEEEDERVYQRMVSYSQTKMGVKELQVQGIS